MASIQTPVVATVIIAVCIVVWVAELLTHNSGVDSVLFRGGLAGPLVAEGDWYRIVTAGFLHDSRFPLGLMHIGFNMYFLYYLGTLLEPGLGRVTFVAAFFVSLLGGSFGALLLSPDSLTVGASGAVFGLVAVALMEMRSRGIPPFQTQLGTILILNIVITFGFSTYISVGGHLGGLAAGAVIGYLLFEVGRGHSSRRMPVLGAIIGLGAALAVASLAIA
jgi:membrane associated rhomboid family serine protease